MRRLIVLLFSAVALNVAAQTLPPKLEPIPEPPPAPAGSLNESMEPQVTISKKGEDTIEEFRVNGQLYMVKVTPPHGVPYYLYDDQGEGNFARRDAQDTGIRVPKWVIKRW